MYSTEAKKIRHCEFGASRLEINTFPYLKGEYQNLEKLIKLRCAEVLARFGYGKRSFWHEQPMSAGTIS